MLIAIIGSHYFEYYFEHKSADFSSLRLFVNAILGDPKQYEEKEEHKWFIKTKNQMFRFLHKWINNVIEDVADEDFGNTSGCKTWIKTMHAAENDVLWFAQDKILNLIKEDLVDDFSYMMQSSELNWVNTHFWVSMIDKYASRYVSPDYFISLLNCDNTALELEQNRRTSYYEEDGYVFDDNDSHLVNNLHSFISKT